jgi:hypothetical protein
MAMPKAAKRPKYQVDQAGGGIERAIRKLIISLASDDEAIDRKAMESLIRRLQPAVVTTRIGEALIRSEGHAAPSPDREDFGRDRPASARAGDHDAHFVPGQRE